MLALIIGIVLIAFTVIAALPMGLAWGQDILLFLRGGLPIFAAFVGLISVFIGIADINCHHLKLLTLILYLVIISEPTLSAYIVCRRYTLNENYFF